ncbi:MAG: DEAD/DEAH box helicase [Myxococcota bacterium]|nr:DEAD/DEAH box helicase [Myxococcota bacterium]MDW8361858.1 DEAD/DEAH box helicase [Myxococcales bacterium]
MNARHVARALEAAYRAYLRSRFAFRDRPLREAFHESLEAFRLVRGPIVEAIPRYRLGAMPDALLRELLGEPIEEPFVRALGAERPLYAHQERAIRASHAGRNVVVATGTGSGKTEAFLLPILMDLYREHREGRLDPGVRAVIVYPMNALVHDQRTRLGTLARAFVEAGSAFRFTYGEYTGSTPETDAEANESSKGIHIDAYALEEDGRVVHGEITTRKEMRQSPPHILMTNYSMLEYMLLRPSDSPFFDGDAARRWRWLVLDEAHVYKGTRAAELALLIARLKQRLRAGGLARPLRCVLTSASLAGGPDDRTAVAQFASKLCGEPFGTEDVVLAEREPLRTPSAAWSLSARDYDAMVRALEGDPTARDEVLRRAASLDVGPRRHGSLEAVVSALLARDARALVVHRSLEEGPRELADLAAAVFPERETDIDRVDATALLLKLLTECKDPLGILPSLSVRYHVFVRGLEGAFVSYLPAPRVMLGPASCEGARFELALCRECGQHYLVGAARDGRLAEAVRDPDSRATGVRFYVPLEEDLDEDAVSPHTVCLRCARLVCDGEPLACACAEAAQPLRVGEVAVSRTHEDRVARCVRCGYQGPDPVAEVVHGSEGPSVVIATALWDALPPEARSILAFTDGRQGAAQFASYLDASSRDLAERALLLDTVRSAQEHDATPLSLSDLARASAPRLADVGFVAPSTSEIECLREAFRVVYREWLTEDHTLSLEGMGLLRSFLRWPAAVGVPPVFLEQPWGLSERDAQALTEQLLATLRIDRAVELRCGARGQVLEWAALEHRAPQTYVTSAEVARRIEGEVRWAAERGRRVDLLRRLLRRLAPHLDKSDAIETCRRTLRALWDWLVDLDRRLRRDGLLVSASHGMRLNPNWWRLVLDGADADAVLCDTCRRRHGTCLRDVHLPARTASDTDPSAPPDGRSFLGVCTRYGCPGELRAGLDATRDLAHYRGLYDRPAAALYRVEEHTAQLKRAHAASIQSDFRAGDIQLLSSSTTFEVGVDLGQLSVVFLRNVPPEPFNYAQRVGRCGRRPGRPGLAVTYCSRRPHDVVHFADPWRLVLGRTRPPTIALQNDVIALRHVFAVVLAHWFRSHPDRFGTVLRTFETLDTPRLRVDLREHVRRYQRDFERVLREILPEPLHAPVGLLDGSWVDRVLGDGSRLDDTEAELAYDYGQLLKYKVESASGEKFEEAGWAKRRLRAFEKEDTLAFLSRKAVIPKYGFPVDVVGLKLVPGAASTGELELERDLRIGIAEYRPGAQLVANKWLIESLAVKTLPRRSLPVSGYARCYQHHVLVLVRDPDTVRRQGGGHVSLPCGCTRPLGRFVEPRFGFVGRVRGPAGRQRPRRASATRPYFAAHVDAEAIQREVGLPADCPWVHVTPASPGRLVVLSQSERGLDLRLCEACGREHGEDTEHQTAWGRTCSGELRRRALGHEFVTHVLRLQFAGAVPSGVRPVSFALSLGYALLGGAAEVLDVPETDLDVVVAHGNDAAPIPPIVLYDDVPGGAGLVAQLEQWHVLEACLRAALRRIDGRCGCAPETSCYGCLRSYRNQFVHHELARGPVADYLRAHLVAESTT